MNEIVNKFFIDWRQVYAQIALRQPGFTDSVRIKHHEKIKKFKETDDLNYIYKIELEKACFSHDAVYVNGKDLA